MRIIEAELRDDTSLAEALAQLTEARVDLLIDKAGTMGDKTVAEAGFAHQTFGSFDRSEWLRVFDSNVCTPMALVELLVDRLGAAEHGIVVTISNTMGNDTLNTMGSSYAYRAGKAAVNSIMKSMGVSLRERGITAVALHPGWVRTQLEGPDAELDVAESVGACVLTTVGLTTDDAGRFIGWHGGYTPC